jgi:PelA/Pel-15E family pectate lyase
MTVLLLTFFIVGIGGNGAFTVDDKSVNLVPIDTKAFGSCIHHWRKLRSPDRFIIAEADQPSYQPSQVREIVDNILLFQRENGGWPKDYDMTAVLTDDQRRVVLATRSKQDTSFDNGNIHSQVEYLAKAISQHPDPAWKSACLRGFDFMLAAQYPNGGYPQRFPDPRGYPAHITFNDGVMIGVLNVLHSAAEGASHFEWLDQERREKAREAVDRAIGCILQCQIRVQDELTGWCQQHDETTFEPRPARTFELASLCPQDTTEIVYFLMRQPSPSAELIQAVDSACSWLRTVQINGFRVEKVTAPRESFPGYDSDKDVVVIADIDARPLWARHYEIGTNRPIFAGRDAVKRYALAEIERERRAGTAWYGHWPEKLINRDYPKWRSAL